MTRPSWTAHTAMSCGISKQHGCSAMLKHNGRWRYIERDYELEQAMESETKAHVLRICNAT